MKSEEMRLGDEARNTNMVLQYLEVILHIRRLWRSFRGAHWQLNTHSLIRP